MALTNAAIITQSVWEKTGKVRRNTLTTLPIKIKQTFALITFVSEPLCDWAIVIPEEFTSPLVTYEIWV